ncbi:MAG: hypothetical protein WCI57_00870 [Candidatus Berkelbacteria bacterium]
MSKSLKLVLTALLLVYLVGTSITLFQRGAAIESLQGQLNAANATISKMESDHKFNKMNYDLAVKHWQKVQADTKASAELYVRSKVSEKQSQLIGYRSQLVINGFREAFRLLTPYQRDIFAQSVDLSVYYPSGFVGKLTIQRMDYLPINLGLKTSAGEQLWQAISIAEERDYQSQWTIFEDGSAKKVSETYNRELKKEGIEIPKPKSL